MLPPTGRYTLGMAQARQEGFFASLTRAARNNNPGNIAWDGTNGFAAAHGATHGDVGPNTPMAVFPSAAMGWAAQTALLSAPARFLRDDPAPLRNLAHGYLGARIEQVIYRYCPPEGKGNTPAGTEAYVHNVATWMGCKRTDILSLAMLQPGGVVAQIQAAAAHPHIVDMLAGLGTWRAAWYVAKIAWSVFRNRKHLAGWYASDATALTDSSGPCDNPATAIPPTPAPDTQETSPMPIEEQKQPEPTTAHTETVDLHANAFADVFTKKLPALFGKHITLDETKAAETAVITFVGKDGLNLATDAVKYVEVKFAGLTSSPEVKAQKLADAKAKFLADAQEAKKDLSSLAGSALNFVMEGALQVAIGQAAKLAATVALSAEAETESAKA